MTHSLALAKISRPRLFGVVPRTRLFEWLDAALAKPLVWICGPPGYGKTSLVDSYLAQGRSPVIWYQVDGGDADPATLFHYLSLAAQGNVPASRAPLPRLSAGQGKEVAHFARLYFRALFARLVAGSRLVLDNYQEAGTGTALDEIVRIAVEELPAGISIIAISRSDPPQSLSRASASNALATLDWERLRLTYDEVRALAGRDNIHAEPLLRAMHQHSHGWAAGVVLMMEHAGPSKDAAVTASLPAREAMFNYLASLAFEQSSAPRREALLAMAYAPQLTPSLVRALTAWPQAPLLLEELYQRRLFTNRRTGPEFVYQFHALFRDFLCERAALTLPAARVAEHKARTARLLEDTADVDVAVALWTEVGDWTAVERVLTTKALALMRDGRWQTLLHQITRVPDTVRRQRPWLLFWLGCAQLQVQPAEGMRSLEQARLKFQESTDRIGSIECLIALLRGAFAGFQALHAMQGWLDALLEEVQRDASFESRDLELRVWSTLCVTLFHVRPWHPWMLPAYEKVDSLLPGCEDGYTQLGAAIAGLTVSGLTATYDVAERIITATQSLASSERVAPSDAAWWWAQVGYLRFKQTRYEESMRAIEEGERIANASGLISVLEVLMLWRVLIEYRLHGWSTANSSMGRFDKLGTARRPVTIAMRDLFRARHAAHLGRMNEVATLAITCEHAVLDSGSVLEELIFGISVSDLLTEAGRWNEADAPRARAKAIIARSPVFEAWCALPPWLDAWLFLCRGDRPAALVKLREALAHARVEAHCHALRFSERSLAPLCALALEERIEPGVARDLIRMFRLKPPMSRPEAWPWPLRIHALGSFDVCVDGSPLEFSRKAPRKLLLLLKAIVAYGGRDVPEQKLCDALWPQEDGDSARNAYAVTILRLRKLLGVNGAVALHDGRVTLDADLVWTDVDAFEQGLTDSRLDIAATLSLYRGAFLQADEDQSWSVATRERLRGKFVHALSQRGIELEARKDPQSAMQCYCRGIDTDPIVEIFYQGLMRCYERAGRPDEAISTYRRLKQVLCVVLGIEPSEATQRLLRDLLSRRRKDMNIRLDAPGSS